MIEEKYSDVEKQTIAHQIKPNTLEKAIHDFKELQNIGTNASNKSSRCRIGNDCVDYFTFVERLNTKGKYNTNFYDFLWNLDEFKKKKFIQTMFTYYDQVKNKNKTKNHTVVCKEVYNICISAINVFRPLVAMEIYTRFKPTCILDFTCGWGGRLFGAAALNVPRYIGFDINTNLAPCYQKITEFFTDHTSLSSTDVSLRIQDALTFDYTSIDYDMVFTSPPYYFLEKYSNNTNYNSKEEMNRLFYEPLFKKTYESLKTGGTYILNVNQEIYNNVCVKLFGKAAEEIPLKKSQRQNNYSEFIYVWFHFS